MKRSYRKLSDVQPIRTRQPTEPNCLGEAFRIASGVSSSAPERAHLVAVIAHCRKLVSALMNLPEVE
jgi:hypothetical protein